jgi:hypothetical protein
MRYFFNYHLRVSDDELPLVPWSQVNTYTYMRLLALLTLTCASDDDYLSPPPKPPFHTRPFPHTRTPGGGEDGAAAGERQAVHRQGAIDVIDPAKATKPHEPTNFTKPAIPASALNLLILLTRLSCYSPSLRTCLPC